MKIVYALEKHYDYEGDTLVSIHTTLEGAEQRAQKERDPDERELEFIQQSVGFWKTWGSPEFHITMWELEP